MKKSFVFLVLVCLVAGCGKPKPETGPVDVTVFDGLGLPASGLDVIVHNSRGDALSMWRTDGSGYVVVQGVPRNGMITIARRELYPYHLQTITRVQPFDVLQFGRPAADPTPVNLELSLFQAHPTAKSYYIDAGCATLLVPDFQPIINLSVPTGCATDAGEISVVVYATDDDLDIHGFSFATNVPLTSGTTLINLPDWVNDRITFNVDIPFVPWGSIGFTRARFVTPTDSFIGSRSIDLADFQRSYVIEGTGALEADFSLPSGFQVALGYSVEIQGNGREAFLVVRDGTLPTSKVFDLEKDLGPFPEDVDFNLFNDSLHVVARPSGSWILSEEPNADASGLTLEWADGPGQPAEFRWDVVASPEDTLIQVPGMPAELQRFVPLTGDEYRTASVWLRDGDFLSSHKDYFQFERFFDDPSSRFDAFPDTFIMKSAVEKEEFQ